MDILTPLSLQTKEIDKKKKKINKDKEYINIITLIYTYIILHSTITKYIFFSSVYAMFARTDHILGHMTSLNKYRKTEITQNDI